MKTAWSLPLGICLLLNLSLPHAWAERGYPAGYWILEQRFEELGEEEQLLLADPGTYREEESTSIDLVSDETSRRLDLLEERLARLSAAAEPEDHALIAEEIGDHASPKIASAQHAVLRPAMLPEQFEFGSYIISKNMPVAMVRQGGAELLGSPVDQQTLITGLAPNLLIAVERRIGAWYRVITFHGERGWIDGNKIMFGPSTRSLPNSIVRIAGVIPDADSIP